MTTTTAKTLLYAVLADGAFVVGDTSTGLTSYAYPTSDHATEAEAHPLRVAQEMIRGEAWRSAYKPAFLTDYDARHWAMLGSVGLCAK